MTLDARDEKPLRVLWLTDDRPGHRNKAAGVLHALRRKRPVEVIEQRVNWRWSAARQMLGRLGEAGLKLPPNWFLTGHQSVAEVDLILSAGGSTQWVNAALSAQLNVPNVFCGSLRKLPASLFDVIPLPDPPTDSAPYLRLDLLPSNISSQIAREAADACFGQRLEGRVWTVLIGGDGEGLRWSIDDLRALTERLVDAASEQEIKLAVATSRRTPPEGERAIRRLVESSGCLFAADWYHDRQGSPSPLAALMGAAERVYVTADSASMTHEAISSGRPVISVHPTESQANERHMLIMQHQKNLGRLADWRLSGDGSPEDVEPVGGWQPISHDPGEALGTELLERLAGLAATSRSAA